MDGILHRNDVIHAPSLLRYEQLSVLRRATYGARITEKEEDLVLSWLFNIPVVFHFEAELDKRAYALAKSLQLTVVYDAYYLALAEELKCDFWTTDQRLIKAAKSTNLRVHWIGDYIVEEQT